MGDESYICLSVGSSFGHDVELVTQELTKFRLSGSSLSELVKRTQLPLLQVKKCLVVLIRHRLVFCRENPSAKVPEKGPLPHVFHIDPEAVWMRNQHPYCIDRMQREFGEPGRLLAEALASHGQQSINELLAHSIEFGVGQLRKRLQHEGHDGDLRASLEQYATQIRAQLLETFVRMVERKWICRGQWLDGELLKHTASALQSLKTFLEPVVAAAAEEDASEAHLGEESEESEGDEVLDLEKLRKRSSSSRGRGGRRGGRGGRGGAQQSGRKRKAEQVGGSAAGSQISPHLLPLSVGDIEDKREVAGNAEVLRQLGLERRSEEELAQLDEANNILWCFRTPSFVFADRADAILAYVRTMYGELAQTIAQSILNGSGNGWRGTLSMAEILDAIQRRQVSAEAPAENPQHMINILCHPEAGILQTVPVDTGIEYRVNYRGILKRIRLQHVLSVVEARYGPLARRMISFLAEGQFHEDVQIGHHCTADHKLVRASLFQMLRDEVVSYRVIPRTQDRFPNTRSWYCWGFDPLRFGYIVLQDLRFTWCRTKQRLIHLQQRNQAILDKIIFEEALTPSEETALAQWQLAIGHLEQALLSLDRHIGLFL